MSSTATELAERMGFRPHEPQPRPWQPLKLVGKCEVTGGDCFESDYYTVTRKRTGSVTRLGISNADQSARRDWREFQQIKNELVGPEVVAIEVYPKESEKVDPSNFFLLWCLHGGLWIDLSVASQRHVLTPDEAIAPQRRDP